ncbi:MAG TPA: alanine racemase [Acidobacteriaceae bacterium]|nr:alanine racemase [Acidobacteriaceae bacterium]
MHRQEPVRSITNRPCWVEISTPFTEANYRLLEQIANASSSLPHVELLAIVKANAYGHGLAIVAPAAVRAGARWLGVTSAEEGVAARAVCPEAEILVISGPFPGQGRAILEHRLTPVVWDPQQLDELEAAARGTNQSIPIHLELDTGMSRQGVSAGDLDCILGRFTPDSPLKLDGLMTHLYAADESDGDTTRVQLGRLTAMVQQIIASGQQPRILHAGNSAALLAQEAAETLRLLCAKHNMQPMLRPGLALYGLVPEFTPDEPAHIAEMRAKLQPALTWKTRIVSMRTIQPGGVIGYNGSFIATEPMRLALLAVGYADGLRRSLSGSADSNHGHVLIHGQQAPITGRISMDQTVVDVTEIPTAGIGEEVVLLGRQGSQSIAAEDHARWAGTIPWEIFTGISDRVARIAADASHSAADPAK